MNNNFKYHAAVATNQCELLDSNEAWLWERLYATSIVNKCIEIIQDSISLDIYDSYKFKQSVQHITDIKAYFQK